MSTGDALVAFLKDRLDEDEQTAREQQSHLQAMAAASPRGRPVRPFRRPVKPAQVADYAWRDRFGPARALAEVEAGRRILDEVLPAVDDLDDIAYGEGQGPMPHGELPALLLKLLALPYADHPSYREEWRP